MEKVVIIGAGFGGLSAANALAGKNIDVLLIDRNNYHAFLPLLYQVAAAEIEAGQIAQPVRSIISNHDNLDFMMATVTGIDTDAKLVQTSVREIAYDYLILAMGTTHHFFGVAGAEQFAFPLKTITQAQRMRDHILLRFEEAAAELDAARRRELLTFVVVGGGPTGVEYAGALQELISTPLRRDFPHLDMDEEVRVVLIEGSAKILSMFKEQLGDYAQKRLERMGVEVITEAFVTSVSAESVTLANGDVLPTHTVVWTAGVKGESLAERWELPTRRNGQVPVTPVLQAPELAEVFVIGDLAYFEQDEEALPMLAQVAMQQGKVAARNILSLQTNAALSTFRYVDKGSMATIGRNAAVAEVGGFAFKGFVAWLLWLFIHIAYLIGFQNKLAVLSNWAWDYFFYERVARLIMVNSAERPST
ncbi:MAG: NAD(P)/FAD-dependent oxidoreductase [Candidatus Promineifilaceae bacterium]